MSEQEYVDEQERENAALDGCLCRLMNGVATPTDFKDFYASLKKFSAIADENAIEGCGELGDMARGVAQAYRAILKRIDDALEPPEKFEQSVVAPD